MVNHLIKRIDLLTHLETIRYWYLDGKYIYLCCFEQGRYWSYRGPYHCERDLISTWLVIHDEIKQIYGGKHAPAWVHQRLVTRELFKPEKTLEDFNDEIPF